MVSTGATDCAKCGHVFTPGVDSPSQRPSWAKRTLYLCIASSVLLLASRAFQWDIIDALTPFLGGPLLVLAWLPILVSVLVASVYAFLQRSKGILAFAPLIISIVVIVIAIAFPFTLVWLHANFYVNKLARERVVLGVKAGVLKPNVKHNAQLITLPKGSGLSKGGDQIVVQGPSDDPYVFFFTFRGILNNYSGFLWVPEGGKPEKFSDAGEMGTQIRSFGGNWYFIGHR
jgi:flagellar biosynthesis protein FliQ